MPITKNCGKTHFFVIGELHSWRLRENIRPRRNESGITTIGLYNFLLDENSMNS